MMIGRVSRIARGSTVLRRPLQQIIRNPQCRSVQDLTSARDSALGSTPRTMAIEDAQLTVSSLRKKKTFKQKIPNLWLRDTCQCNKCVNQDTRQRNFDTFAIPKDIHPVKFMETAEQLKVQWSDGHVSEHLWTWLDGSFTGHLHKSFGNDHDHKLWGETIQKSPPQVLYQDVVKDKNGPGMAELTRNIRIHGFTFVEETPPTPEATESLLEKIGPIRNTHYGGFYDFIPDLALADTAYTNIALPAHTDTTYFSEPAGLQAFHLLSHTASPDAKPTDGALGGQSLLVDGFNIAENLKREDPKAFYTLCSIAVPWHASGNEGVAISPDRAYPVIEHGRNFLSRIRWNNDDRGVVQMAVAPRWYEAARKWDEILRRPSNQFWFQLTPGRVVIFDNWRVLHGRAAFEGVRRICGAYIPRDDFMSRYRTTNFPIEKVIGRNLHLRPTSKEKAT